DNDPNVILAARNIETLSTISVNEINTYEVVSNAVVILTKGSVKKLEEAYC
ncbi:MAG: 50S ribosomal protein L4, partial [Clostridiales bacterium]|nr:50S ribosomal protein L4 [Clostridiales bacterium]